MYTISSQPFSLSILNRIVSEQLKIKLSEEIKENIINCRKYLDKKITTSLDPIYGINTGFGSLCDVKIDSINLVKLQENLEEYIGLKQNWLSFSAKINNEIYLPKKMIV